jgi:DNA-directed RNA polymerase subunit RPC12/RpoP
MLKTEHLKAYIYKACPRCHGDLILDQDMDEDLLTGPSIEYSCLQCGRRVSLEPTRLLRRPEVPAQAA